MVVQIASMKQLRIGVQSCINLQKSCRFFT
jgi:hypothetical protein